MILKIDDVAMPACIEYNIPDFDLDSPDSHRNLVGSLRRVIIRKNIYKAEVKYKMLTNSEFELIKSAISPAKIKVQLITENGLEEKYMYAGDRKSNLVVYDTNREKLRWDLAFNLVEY